MDIKELGFMSDLIDACNCFWKAGWGEFHAGNISYLLSDDEVKEITPYLNENVNVQVDFDTSDLNGKIFVVTRSGACFRTMKKRYKEDLGIIQFHQGSYKILWGLMNGQARATSELPAHVLCHCERLKDNKNNKIIMHCHPTYLNAMTMIHDLDEETFTKTLWKMNSECSLVFPEGLAILPWMVCGEGKIGPSTAQKMQHKRVVIWPFHGVFSSGASIDEAIGLIETLDKNALVYVNVHANMKQSMTDDNVRELKQHFNLN